MKLFRIIPCLISCLLLAAHFYRANSTPMALLAFCIPLLLILPKQGVRLTQLLLILGSLEWLRTLYILMLQRQELNQPWLRLVIIITIVSLITGASALPLSGLNAKTDAK